MKKIIFFISLFFLSFFSFAENKSSVIDKFSYNNVTGGIMTVYNPDKDFTCYNIVLSNYKTPKYCDVIMVSCDEDDALFWYGEICKDYKDIDFFEDYKFLFDDWYGNNGNTTEIKNGVVIETTYFTSFDF